jgi:two-component system, OmpR family, sensor kinase
VRSIRANLVLWVVSTLAVGTVVVLAATYVLTRNQVGSLFDEELKQVALAVHLREDWTQTRRVRIARPGFALSVRAYDASGRIYFETALPSLPTDLPQSFTEGIAFVETVEGPWRVYTHVTEEGTVQVGQAVATRDALARELSLSVLMPMLLLIPVLGMVVAWALERGLQPLHETSRRVSDRDASRLDPLPTDNVPRELLPLVHQINGLLARLDAALDAQRRFLADAAHELRSPVAALALQVQLAERGQSPAARSAALHELARGVERARRLVQQLMDFARLDSAAPLQAFAAVNLAGLARDVVGSYAARAERQDVDLGVEAPGVLQAFGAEPELRSLLENLVDNALRYAPAGSPVTVSVREAGGMIELSVIDAGRGVPPAERERVFERFHRVAGDATQGTGLGLAIVKAIVERHHGAIELSDADPSSEQPGLAVRIRLPAWRGHARSPEHALGAVEEPDRARSNAGLT